MGELFSRRRFLGGASALGTAVLADGCRAPRVQAPALAGDRAWAVLFHMGSNMWKDWSPDETYPKSPVEENAILAAEAAELKAKGAKPRKAHLSLTRDYMSVDWKTWREDMALAKAEGVNMVFIDIGEAYRFPSHPELGVVGSLSPDEMRVELARIRAMGMEPVPKLNFSTGHDQWLKQYHFMTSSPTYYAVVADLIADVCEVFDTPRYFHLGFDEEIFGAVKRRVMPVMRQGKLWWKDFLYCVREVERHGVRAMLWSDKICAGREEFFRNMPKSVLQCPWYYRAEFSPAALAWKREFETSQEFNIQKNLAGGLAAIVNAGYDVMPCTSNWDFTAATEAMFKYCKDNVSASQLKGIMTAPWTKPVPDDQPRTHEGLRLFGAAKRKYFPG